MSRFTELMAQHGQYHLIKNNLKNKEKWHVTEEEETIVKHHEEKHHEEEVNLSVKYL